MTGSLGTILVELTVALGLLANGTYGEGYNGVQGTVTGLLYGDSGQFIASCIGIVANILPEMGMPGYATETGTPILVEPAGSAAVPGVATAAGGLG